MRRHTLGSLLIAGCALSWGTIGLIVREVDLPAMAIVFWRVGLAAAAVAAVLLAMGRRELFRLHGNRAAFALGLLLALHWSLYFAAIKETSVAGGALIVAAGIAVVSSTPDLPAQPPSGACDYVPGTEVASQPSLRRPERRGAGDPLGARLSAPGGESPSSYGVAQLSARARQLTS